MVVIICIIVGVLIEMLGFGDTFMAVINGVVGALIGLFISVIISAIVDEKAEKETYIYKEEPIYALSDNESIEGSFFLGSGRINGDMKYVFIAEEENGKIMKDINAGNTYIIEDDDEEPRIEYYYERYKNKSIPKYFFGIDDSFSHYVVRIPEDSIMNQYKIDLE